MKLSPCANCTKGCCKQYLVTVTGYDAFVIAKELQLAPEQFLMSVPQKDPTIRGFYLDSSQQRYDIALDKVGEDASGQPSTDRACVFWVAFPSGVGRCGIYPYRPYVCQTYPAVLGHHTQNSTYESSSLRREDVLCAETDWRDGRLQETTWHNRLVEMYFEFDFYAILVARWNHHVMHVKPKQMIPTITYYAYLMNMYTQLEPLRMQFEPQTWVHFCQIWLKVTQAQLDPMLEPELINDVPGMEFLRKAREILENCFSRDGLVSYQNVKPGALHP